MHNAFLGVQPAQIEWRQFDPEKHQWLEADWRQLSELSDQRLAPYSPAFDDIYFNPEDGIAESTHVFLEGNDLKERFQSHDKPFHIFETGFGTGLNFLLTTRLWQETAAPNAELHFWSVEQFPIGPEDLRKIYQILGLEPELSESLIEQYPDAMPGIYHLAIAPNITLHLVFYPLKKALTELAIPNDFSFDAWFLDGFAPSKNPEMWVQGLLHFMALHSTNGSTLATFTVAAALRKPLPHYGFAIEKRPGFGRKREMLTAKFSEKELSTPKPSLADDYLQAHAKPQQVAVIGAGLAGCALAYELNRHAIEVHLFDKNSDICGGASNMPSLVASPAMSIDHNAYSQLTFLGFERLKAFVRQHPELTHSTFAHQLDNKKYSAYHLEQYQEAYAKQVWSQQQFQFEDIVIGEKPVRCLKIPAIQVNGKAFCQKLIEDLPSEQLHLNTEITELEQLQDFDQVIIANGYRAPDLPLKPQQPQIAPMRGQLTTLKHTLKHQSPINHNGHLAHYQDRLIIGATFENNADESIQRESSLQNIEQVNQRFGFEFSAQDIAQEHPGVRATSYDRFPFCGFFTSQEQQNIWLNYGFGSRGLCFSLLCAEVITNAMLETASPLPKTLLSRISAHRV